jgi:hypothetical protein
MEPNLHIPPTKIQKKEIAFNKEITSNEKYEIASEMY